MDSPAAPPTKSVYSAYLVEFFMLQFGCGFLFILHPWIGLGWCLGFFFLGAYMVLEDVYTMLDNCSPAKLSHWWRALLLRLVSFLIGAFFGGLFSLAFVVLVNVTGIGRNVPGLADVASLICLVSAVIAGSLEFVGRKLHGLARRSIFWSR